MLGNNDLVLFKHNAKRSALGLCYSVNMKGMKKFPPRKPIGQIESGFQWQERILLALS